MANPNSNRPWCSQHNMHPNDCFEDHYPNGNKGSMSEAETRNAIIKEHLRRQNESILEESEKPNESVIDARKRFEENHRKGA